MPRCPGCRKFYFLSPLISLNDGSGGKVCESCFKEHQIVNKLEFQQRCLDKEEDDFIIPMAIGMGVASTHGYEIDKSLDFKSNGGEFGGAGASGSWDPPTTPDSSPETYSSSESDSSSPSDDFGGNSEGGGGSFE